jgi:hypothetical protein
MEVLEQRLRLRGGFRGLFAGNLLVICREIKRLLWPTAGGVVYPNRRTLGRDGSLALAVRMFVLRAGC